MTKLDLVRKVAAQTGYEQVTINAVLDSAMENIMGAVANGETVYLRGFGAFSSHIQKGRVAQHIRSRMSILVPEHKKPFFKPYPEFKEMLNK